jgi:hypothetical protein
VFPLAILLLVSALPADTGFMTVRSNLPGLGVYLDGDWLGRVPVEMHKVKPGRHTLGIVSDDSLENVYWRLRTADPLTRLSSVWTLAAINAGTTSVEVLPGKLSEVMIDYGQVLAAPTQAKLTACGTVGGILLIGAVFGFLLHLVAFR